MRDTTQKFPVACDIEPCTVYVKENPQQKVQAPSMIEVERDSEANLVFSNDSKQKRQILKGRIRWSESILPNALLAFMGPQGVLAAIGMSIDYFTGNMFELPAPKPVKFRDEPFKHNPQHIVIAPVTADTQLESDEAVVYVLEAIRKQYPKAKVEVPEQYWRHFERAGWTGTEFPSENWKLYDLYAELKTPYVVVGKVLKSSQEEKFVQFSLKDTYRHEVVFKETASYQSQYKKGDSIVWAKSKLVDLIPNAVSLSSVTSRTSGYAMSTEDGAALDGKSLDSSYSSYNLSGSPEMYKQRNDWEISLANLDPDLGRRFSFVFRWATDATLRKSSSYLFKQTVSYTGAFSKVDYQDSIQNRIDQYFMGASIGPEVGVAGFLGYLYWNVIAGAELMYADLSGGGQQLWEVYSPMTVNLGHKFRITESLHFGWGISAKLMPEWVNTKVMSAAAGEKLDGGVSSEMRTNVGLTYQFPEMKTMGRSQVRKMVTN
ncbi:hypothetical protein [Bdellovibrio sp. HCB337]|uniref:hypothetical protein n=1 Tax=Bdellovibrio sp. HCB337 TaxID=3394358 RepID=UPI0039A46244